MGRKKLSRRQVSSAVAHAVMGIVDVGLRHARRGNMAITLVDGASHLLDMIDLDQIVLRPDIAQGPETIRRAVTTSCNRHRDRHHLVLWQQTTRQAESDKFCSPGNHWPAVAYELGSNRRGFRSPTNSFRASYPHFLCSYETCPVSGPRFKVL